MKVGLLLLMLVVCSRAKGINAVNIYLHHNDLLYYLIHFTSHIYLDYFIDFNCPASKRLTKKTIRIGAGESAMYNTNPGGANK